MAYTYWSEMWEEWFRPLSKDCLRTFSVLAVLYVFWEVISLMRYRGYPDTYIQPLEKTHFAFMYASLLVIGASFVFKLAATQWRSR
jgi:hypothetical protein